MRLIDADALSDLLVETYEKAPTEKALLFVALLLKNNEQVPTFEERPQGEWKFDSKYTEFGNPYGTYKCSCCGGHSSDKYPYCFWCGADMRGTE